jgi:uncharacterized protein YbjT (DUF2867 family)
MKIAITGAFSYSGKYVAQRLLARGEEVLTLTGHPSRPDPFLGNVEAHPLDFTDEPGLAASLRGTDIFINTYWVRFDRGSNTFARAVENTRKLVAAAKTAGIRRILHLSVTNPASNSPLPYYSGKAAQEKIVLESGMPYAIIRPSLVFGDEDILLHNIAFLMRKLPFFGLPGDGKYRVQPVYVEDVADLVVEAVYRKDNYTVDAVGPDTFTFKEMLALIGRQIGAQRPLIPLPPSLALRAAQLMSLYFGDVLLTREEVDGLMANLLVSNEPPLCKTRLADWLQANRESVGAHYVSELKRHYE